SARYRHSQFADLERRPGGSTERPSAVTSASAGSLRPAAVLRKSRSARIGAALPRTVARDDRRRGQYYLWATPTAPLPAQEDDPWLEWIHFDANYAAAP